MSKFKSVVDEVREVHSRYGLFGGCRHNENDYSPEAHEGRSVQFVEDVGYTCEEPQYVCWACHLDDGEVHECSDEGRYPCQVIEALDELTRQRDEHELNLAAVTRDAGEQEASLRASLKDAENKARYWSGQHLDAVRLLRDINAEREKDIKAMRHAAEWNCCPRMSRVRARLKAHDKETA